MPKDKWDSSGRLSYEEVLEARQGAPRKVLEILNAQWPEPLSMAELAHRTGLNYVALERVLELLTPHVKVYEDYDKKTRRNYIGLLEKAPLEGKGEETCP